MPFVFFWSPSQTLRRLLANSTAAEERVAARSGMNGPAGGTAAASDGDNNDVHLSRKWRDDRWLKEHEGTGLTEANVLDYFALSEW